MNTQFRIPGKFLFKGVMKNKSNETLKMSIRDKISTIKSVARNWTFNYWLNI